MTGWWTYDPGIGCPADFFLPPPTNAGLWRETIGLTVGCYAFIFVLAVIVALTQGIVVRV
jgi:hypothetical protein